MPVFRTCLKRTVIVNKYPIHIDKIYSYIVIIDFFY